MANRRILGSDIHGLMTLAAALLLAALGLVVHASSPADSALDAPVCAVGQVADARAPAHRGMRSNDGSNQTEMGPPGCTMTSLPRATKAERGDPARTSARRDP